MSAPRAMAIGAHPDDVEFVMAGTLVLLRQAGYEIHSMNVADGSLGSHVYPPAKLRRMRLAEVRAASRILGAVHHPPLVGDLDIVYEPRTLYRLAAVIREVGPTILLVPSPADYMEDHTNACRLAVSAAFVRSMENCRTIPPTKPRYGDVTIYHAMPAGLRDPLRRRVIPGLFVDTTSVFKTKLAALAEHKSQQDWLAETQKMNHYVKTMEAMSLGVGRMSRRFRHAEGWRRHLHWGYGTENADPLREVLGKRCLVNRAYERALEKGAQ
ncbi:MAG: PIG-L family deacetylase [Verrucomicrobia bacterium]|nr:PIG-L family deacetylase [Verrucomicrobiota bacterium]